MLSVHWGGEQDDHECYDFLSLYVSIRLSLSWNLSVFSKGARLGFAVGDKG